jgi:hypothetical protein
MCGMYGHTQPVMPLVTTGYPTRHCVESSSVPLPFPTTHEMLPRVACGKNTTFPRFQHQSWKSSRMSSRAASTCFLNAGSRSISSSTFRIEWITVE